VLPSPSAAGAPRDLLPQHERSQIIMAKVPPYHTITPEKPYGQHDVYHDHDDCPEGRKIERKNWRPGMDGRDRCEDCISLG
jgi:hypothetical protein